MLIRTKHLSAAGNALLAKPPGGTLWSVNVNTGGASATLTVYDGIDNTGTVVAVVDASATGSYWYGSTLTKGIYVVLANTADVTIGYE